MNAVQFSLFKSRYDKEFLELSYQHKILISVNNLKCGLNSILSWFIHHSIWNPWKPWKPWSSVWNPWNPWNSVWNNPCGFHDYSIPFHMYSIVKVSILPYFIHHSIWNPWNPPNMETTRECSVLQSLWWSIVFEGSVHRIAESCRTKLNQTVVQSIFQLQLPSLGLIWLPVAKFQKKKKPLKNWF